jgi:hypothetical protein
VICFSIAKKAESHAVRTGLTEANVVDQHAWDVGRDCGRLDLAVEDQAPLRLFELRRNQWLRQQQRQHQPADKISGFFIIIYNGCIRKKSSPRRTAMTRWVTTNIENWIPDNPMK